MKKILGLTIAVMLVFSSIAYAGGDQNCGEEGQGTTGSSGQGEVVQKRAPNPDWPET